MWLCAHIGFLPNFRFMTQSSSSGLADFDPELERTILRNLRKIRGALQISPIRLRQERSGSSTMANQNENANLLEGNQFENPMGHVERVLPFDAVPLREGNGNNVPIIPPAGVNPPVAPMTMLDYYRPNLDGASTSIAWP